MVISAAILNSVKASDEAVVVVNILETAVTVNFAPLLVGAVGYGIVSYALIPVYYGMS